MIAMSFIINIVDTKLPCNLSLNFNGFIFFVTICCRFTMLLVACLPFLKFWKSANSRFVCLKVLQYCECLQNIVTVLQPIGQRKKSRRFVYSWFHYQQLLHWSIDKERCISHMNPAPAMSKNSIIFVDSVRKITVTFKFCVRRNYKIADFFKIVLSFSCLF